MDSSEGSSSGTRSSLSMQGGLKGIQDKPYQTNATLIDMDAGDLLSLHVDGLKSLHLLSPSVHVPENSPPHFTILQKAAVFKDLDDDDGMYAKLEEAFNEIVKLKKENFEESTRRQHAEKEMLLMHQKVKKLQGLCMPNVHQMRESEKLAARDMDEEIKRLQLKMASLEEEISHLKQENESLKIQRDEYLNCFLDTNDQREVLMQCMSDADRAQHDLENDIGALKCQLDFLKDEKDVLEVERDTAVRDAAELRNREQTNCLFSEYEIEQATEGFSESLKIGEGGCGIVYKGFIRNTTVAIKVLKPESLQGHSHLLQEASILSKVRHPHLVTLIGICPEASALVYEYFPNGSLEERIACTNDIPALSWQARTRIIGEICSALIFLHGTQPHPVVHGDLKPANILLDANLVSKLSDFGLSRFLTHHSENNTSLIRTMTPSGTLHYIDPEFMVNGELTPRSDVYALGIIMLQLLTSKHPMGLLGQVEEAFFNDSLHLIIDKSAGDWPFVQAQQLAHIAVRCSSISRKDRPELLTDIWPVVGPLMKLASSSVMPSTSGSVFDESKIPSYFFCPILQDVMRDPQFAADGFTYEAEGIKGWLEAGHNTSPMTNLPLPNLDLVPNHGLRSVIKEFLEQHNLQCA